MNSTKLHAASLVETSLHSPLLLDLLALEVSPQVIGE